jgi:hypothetical protein
MLISRKTRGSVSGSRFGANRLSCKRSSGVVRLAHNLAHKPIKAVAQSLRNLPLFAVCRAWHET